MEPREQDITDDADFQALNEDQKRLFVEILDRMLTMGIFAVYGEEADGCPDAAIDCGRYLAKCRGTCCRLTFALTKQEVEQGLIRYDARRPFFVAHDADGFCAHFDREERRCTVWSNRPLRCRKYDCEDDPLVWGEGGKRDQELTG